MMNLKEAFRFQNKIGALMDEAQNVLGRDANITRVENTYLCKRCSMALRMRPSSMSRPRSLQTGSRRSSAF